MQIPGVRVFSVQLEQRTLPRNMPVVMGSIRKASVAGAERARVRGRNWQRGDGGARSQPLGHSRDFAFLGFEGNSDMA